MRRVGLSAPPIQTEKEPVQGQKETKRPKEGGA